MSKTKNKLTFEVQENETIDQCLDRIQNAGYVPIRRREKPIFKEVNNGGEDRFEPVGRQIVFEAKKQNKEKPNIIRK